MFENRISYASILYDLSVIIYWVYNILPPTGAWSVSSGEIYAAAVEEN